MLVKNLQTFNTNSLLHVLKVNDIVLINESIQNLPVELVVPLLNAIHEALQISKFKIKFVSMIMLQRDEKSGTKALHCDPNLNLIIVSLNQ